MSVTPGSFEKMQPSRGWWVLLVSESVGFLMSFFAFWLTVQSVQGGNVATELNPVAGVVLSWSQLGLAVVGVSGLLFGFGSLRILAIRHQSEAIIAAVMTGGLMLAGASTLDAWWNAILLAKANGLATVGAPGPATGLFLCGGLLYLSLVPLTAWKSRQREGDYDSLERL